MLIRSSAHTLRFINYRGEVTELGFAPSPRKEGSESVPATKCVLRYLGFNRRASFNILCFCFNLSSFTVFFPTFSPRISKSSLLYVPLPFEWIDSAGPWSHQISIVSLSLYIAPHPSRFLRVNSTMPIKALRIGIEIEVLLCAKTMKDQCKSSSEDFAQSLVDYYNSKVCGTAGLAEMRYALDLSHASDDPTNFMYWSLTEDGSIGLTEGRYKLLRSPSLRPCEEILAPSPSRANVYCARGSRICITHFTLRIHQLMAPESALAFPDYSELR